MVASLPVTFLLLPGGFALADSPTITEYPSAGGPDVIAAGPDGNLWFTEFSGNKVGKISPSGAITEFPLPTASSGPDGITAGPDGNLWFSEFNGNKIGKISPSGAIAEFPIPTAFSEPAGITVGPDGNLWFPEYAGNKIGKITPTGAITENPIPTSNSGPNGITTGPDGNLWFTENSAIGEISPSGAFTEYPIPTSSSSPVGIAAGPDGNLWLSEGGVGRDNTIGRITPSGAITEFPLPTPFSEPAGITAGRDGNIWFTEGGIGPGCGPGSGPGCGPGTGKIGKITPSGAITEFPLRTPFSEPAGITAGPDGNLWFTEFNGDKIGRITSGTASPTPASPSATPAPSPKPSPSPEEPPVEPCVRVAIEHTKDVGLALFSVAGQQHSSIDKDLTSDGLFHVTAYSDTGLGLDILAGFKTEYPGAGQAQAYIDTSFHVDFGSTQRTYWTAESDANEAIQFANEWGNVRPSDQAIWNGRLVSDSSQLGLDVAGYEGFGAEVRNVGVDVNSGDSGVLWLTRGTDPQTGESFISGVLHLTLQQGAGAGVGVGGLDGLLSGDVVATVTYTEDQQASPKKLLIGIEAGVTGDVSVVGADSWDFYKKLFALGSVGVGVEGTLEVDASVQQALTSPMGRDGLGVFAQSMSDANKFLSALRSIVTASEMRVAVYTNSGTTSKAGGEAGAGLFLTFGAQWGSASLTKTLLKAGYADNGLNLREWTQCENGGTPASLDTA